VTGRAEDTARAEAGEMALQALEKLVSAAALEDVIYEVREREGQGWNGPLVTAWSDGCTLVREALVKAGIKVPAPFDRPTFGQPPEYYTFS
jgi:hypothetical protein